MTVCIAAFANHRKDIVLVSDLKVAFGDFSADNAVQKNIPLVGDYAILFAGNDVAHAGMVVNRVKKKLRADKSLRSADGIAETVFEECKRERDRISEAKILNKHGYDRQTFCKDVCTDAVFYDIHSKLEQTSLSLDFIIAGFDDDKTAHIRFTNCETPPQDYDVLGFYAIGSGAHAALASLSHTVGRCGMLRYRPIGAVTYDVLSAKFMAESATDVGNETFVVVITSGVKDPLFVSTFGGMQYIRRRWESEGAPKMPSGISDAIEDLLSNNKDRDKKEVVEKVAKHCPEAREYLESLDAPKSQPPSSEKSAGKE